MTSHVTAEYTGDINVLPQRIYRRSTAELLGLISKHPQPKLVVYKYI
jgi:hypothetical protein